MEVMVMVDREMVENPIEVDQTIEEERNRFQNRKWRKVRFSR